MPKKLTKLQQKDYTWENALKDFLFFKQAQGLSNRTISDYKKHANLFFKRFPDTWSTPGFKSSVLEYMADDIKPATYNLRLVYLKTFFEYCIKEGFMTENPLKDFKKRKAQSRIVDIHLDTLKNLLALPNQKSFAGLRDYALIMFTLDTGTRPNEALSLKLQNFDLAHNLVTIPGEVAKTRTPRTLPILSKTSAVINKLISVRYHEWTDNVPVFCTCEGTPLDVGSYRNRLRYYSNELGQRIKPYDLRHAFALLYLRNGGHAFGLQKTLGHTDLGMTKRYLNLSGEDLQTSHRQASPLNDLVASNKGKERMRGI
ncbi:MAG: tyrosine-type recombinase/integrase [Clostridia bacterium]|nr:tyrosine-type recombinase/integrase [Clostridia bacterium]